MIHASPNPTALAPTFPAMPGALEATPLVTGNAVVWSLFWRAFTGMLAVDIFGLVRDFARMHRFVSQRRVGQPKAPRPTVTQVCTAINYACVWYPKRVLCLQRSIVTTCLLRSYGIPASMIVGAQTLPFKAHAWTEVDGNAVNERRAVKAIYDVLERW